MALHSLVYSEDVVDPFTILMRGAVLGLTRFPILAHIPKTALWYRLEINPEEILQFRVINETSWWAEFGICTTIGSIASTVTKISTLTQCSQGGHCAKIASMMQPDLDPELDRSIIGVTTSWNAIGNGGVTIIDGNHRGVSFVANTFTSLRSPTLTLYLGIDQKFGRGWKGNFWCGPKEGN